MSAGRHLNRWPTFGIALGTAVAVAAIKRLTGHVLGFDTPFALLGLGVVLSGWLGGAFSAVLTTMLLAPVCAYFVFSPRGGSITAAAGTIQVATFLLEGFSISGIFASIAKARAMRDETAARERVARQRLEVLGDLGAALAPLLSREQVAKVVVERGTRAMTADTCTLYWLDHREDTLKLIGDVGVAPEVLARIRAISGSDHSASFDTLRTGRGLWVESEEEYHKLFPDVAHIHADGPRARAFWSMPLMVEGRPMGLLGMGFYQPRVFPADERAFIETFTGHCSQALLRAQRMADEQAARGAAERAEASLATTLKSIGDAVIATDRTGQVTFMNPVAERLTGWQESEARGRPLRTVFRIVNETTRLEVESPVDKVLREGNIVGLANHTVLLGLRPGQETPIDDSGAPIRDESGVHGVVLVFRDVSAHKSEEARRNFLADATSTLASSLDYHATLKRLATLLVPRFGDWCAVDIIDAETRTPKRLVVTHIDPAKVRLATDLAEKYPDAPDRPAGVRNVIRTGKAELYPHITDEMVQATARDDEHRRILSALSLRAAMIVPLVARGQTLGAISLVQAESGRTYSADDLAFMEDLARRAGISIDNAHLYEAERRARLAADIANRTKDEFLATVSHELRTPLNAILGWARLMAKTPSDERRRDRAIEVIDRNAVAMTQLIEDLLDVSRIISGKVRLEVGAVELDRVVQAAVDSVRLAIEAKELKLQLSISPEVVPVVGDANRLQQVLWNLLTNAVKFTSKGGRIEVTAERHASFIEIKVADTGKGIGADFLPFVFDPFRQGDGTITRAQGGLGLGLAISRHLVELHGGWIRVESDGDGRGATFSVGLPIRANRERTASPTSARGDGAVAQLGHPPQLKGLRVLAVDDDRDARHLVQTVLEECGSTVRVAATVTEALRAIEEQIPDVLLSDIGMPGEDGYSLIRRVRSLPALQGGQVPAAALTAYTRAEDRAQVLDAGYTMHVPKPVAPDELITVVARLAHLVRRDARDGP